MSSPAPSSSPAPTSGHPSSSTPGGLIALAWTLVGVPLVYGLYQTIKTAIDLFTG